VKRERWTFTHLHLLVSHLSACGDYGESSLSARRDRDSISWIVHCARGVLRATDARARASSARESRDPLTGSVRR